jgi:hypothetical protein
MNTIAISNLGPRTVIGFGFNAGAPATNAAPQIAAPYNERIGMAIVTVTASDPSVALTFQILQNGTDVFSTDPTLAGGTATGVYTFPLRSAGLTVAKLDVFQINITSGANAWIFTVQLVNPGA